MLNQMLKYELYLAELFFSVAERTESSFNKGRTTTDTVYLSATKCRLLTLLFEEWHPETHCLSAVKSKWGVFL